MHTQPASKIAEHGGINEDDVHTALLVSLTGMESGKVHAAVSNQQVAPTNHQGTWH